MKATSPKGSTAEQVDRELARAALQKRQAGQLPTQRELSALRRIEEARDRELRERHYAAVPKRDYCRLAGRQVKVVNEQADRYGLPLRGESIDLGNALRAFHDLLAEHGRKILAVPEEDPDADGLKALRREKALLARYERQEREGELLPRADVHQFLTALAARINQCGELLQRHFGAEALEILNEAIADIERLVQQKYGG